MSRHVLSVLVENESGVLSRVAGLFSRRGYNIDSLSVGETEDPLFSRITIVVHGDDLIIEQIMRQLDKLVEVKKISDLPSDKSVFRELALVKVQTPAEKRAFVIEIAEIFRANIVDVAKESLTIELIGDGSKIKAFLELVEPYGVKEIARTGLTALGRGDHILKEL